MYEAALNQLPDKDYVKAIGVNDEIFELTHAGWQLAVGSWQLAVGG